MPKVRTSTGKGRRRQETTADRGSLYPGAVMRGVIVDYDMPRLTYTVNVQGQAVPGVIDVSGPMSSLVGFKSVFRYAPGTPVALLYGNPSWIIGSGVQDPADANSYQSRTMTGKGLEKALADTNPGGGDVPDHSAPEDLYEGEFEISNAVGTFIRFLTFMASIGSGDRAKVECHLLRDLVRIVSRNYEHFSATGDMKIFDDGRLNMEMHGTTYDHERWGRLKPNDPKFTMQDSGMPKDLDPLETGRWRYSFLLGFAGDLFNAWFTDPQQAIGKLVDELTQCRAGKARLYVGQDGTLLAQTCSEIVLEKVVRCQVPIRIAHEEDPEGVLRKEMKELDEQFLKLWDTGGVKTEHHTLLQIREYARYLNQYHTLARLHQLAKDWKINSESDSPAPTVAAGEDDREKANPGGLTYWKDGYTTIRIMRDGSTLTFDTYGNETATGPYGIRHSTPRHYQVFAAGDYVVKAGGSVFISARRHLEFVAHRGSLLMKARTGLRALCEVGTLWLKSDYKPAEAYTPEDGDPEAEVTGNQGIRIQTTGSEIGIRSWLKMRLTTLFAGEDPEEPADIELKPAGAVSLQSKKDLKLIIQGKLIVQAKQAIEVTTRVWHNWVPGGFLLDRVALFKPGQSLLNRIKTFGVTSFGSISGPKRLGMPEPNTKGPLRPHTNHINVFEPEDGELEQFGAQLTTEAPELTQEPPSPDESGFSWSLLPPSEYRWENKGLNPDKEGLDLFEPLAQQMLRLDATEDDGYAEWPNMTDVVRGASQTAADTPWPGPGARWLQCKTSADRLDKPTSKAPTEFGPDTQTTLTSASPTFKFLTR